MDSGGLTPSERAYIRTLFARPKYADAIAQEFAVLPRFVIARADGTVEHVTHSAEVEAFCEGLQREWRDKR